MAVSDNEIVVRDQKVAGSNPVTSTIRPILLLKDRIFLYVKNTGSSCKIPCFSQKYE